MASDAIAEEQQLQVEMEGLDDEVSLAASCTRALDMSHVCTVQHVHCISDGPSRPCGLAA